MNDILTGYLHHSYPQSLAEFGIPYKLPQSRGWILKRKIPGFSFYDAMGCYPLFACQDWSQLHFDLDNISDELICLSLVTDPFGEYDLNNLESCFNLVMPFKKHFTVDTSVPLDKFVSKHHFRYASKALKNLFVERCEKPLQYLDDWIKLYSILINRHKINGIPAFSKDSFSKQFKVPGLVAFRAAYDDKIVGMILWFKQGQIGYYHLGAYNVSGYELRASFALFWYAIEYFSNIGLKWLNLGAGAGIQDKSEDGLTRFKSGWSNSSLTTYFCGRIFDKHKYFDIIREKNIPQTSYFPAYRLGEF